MLCAGQLQMNSFSLYMSEKVFISFSVLKDIFSGYGILGWQFFFSVLQGLPCVVSGARTADILIFVPLYKMCLKKKPLAALKTFPLSLILCNLMMFLGIVFSLFLLLVARWASWICGFIDFIKFEIFSAFIYFTHFSVFPLPPQNSTYVH